MDIVLDEEIVGSSDENEFAFYKSFHNLDEAKSFIQILKDYDIPYTADSSETIIDEVIVGSGLFPKAIVKIHPANFKIVNSIIENQLNKLKIDDVIDHYLNQLDDEELIDIFEKPDEWSVEDQHIAQIILEGRGTTVSDEEILKMRDSRLSEVREGKKGSPFWMTIYFISVAISLFAGIVFLIAGVGMGYYYSYGKSVDQDGNKYYTFDGQTRVYGKLILYGGICLAVILFIVFLINEIDNA